MKNKNWLRNIQQGKSKEIARLFFRGFTTQEKVSRFLYPSRTKKAKGESKRTPKDKQQKTHYVEPIVNIRCKEWNDLGFFEKSEPITFKDKLGRPQKVYNKIMNLKPLYLYCKEKHKIEFNDREKSFINHLFSPDIEARKFILLEYPEDNIINATIKFYIKHFVMPYGKLHNPFSEDKKELPYDEEALKILEYAENWAKKMYQKGINEKNSVKPYFDITKKLMKEEIISKKILNEFEKKGFNNLNEEERIKLSRFKVKAGLFHPAYFYILKHIDEPKFIFNIDAKFMRVLGIL